MGVALSGCTATVNGVGEFWSALLSVRSLTAVCFVEVNLWCSRSLRHGGRLKWLYCHLRGGGGTARFLAGGLWRLAPPSTHPDYIMFYDLWVAYAQPICTILLLPDHRHQSLGTPRLHGVPCTRSPGRIHGCHHGTGEGFTIPVGLRRQ